MPSRLARTAGAAALMLVLSAAVAQAASPSAFVYATSRAQTVHEYKADEAGRLADLFPSDVPAESTSTWAAVSPNDRNLYVVNQASATVSQYDIQNDGTLAAKATPTVPTGSSPLGIAIARDGRHAYVANQGGDSVTVYAVNAAGGLSEVSTAPAGDAPGQIAVTPDGAHAYVTNYLDDTISQYDVDAATGSLTREASSTVATLNSPAGIAVSPDGGSVYVANQGSAALTQYSVDADGALTPKDPVAVATGSQPREVLAVDSGVYVSNLVDGTLSQYDIGTGGALVPKTPATVTAPSSPTGLAASPDGHSVYVAGFADNVVGQYDVRADGTLLPKDPFTVAANLRPSALAVARPPDLQPPTVDLRTPADGAQYTMGERVDADYSCADEGGSGLESCSGDVDDGAPIDTSTAGPHTFTVVARDRDGHEITVTHSYTVGGGLTFEGFVGPIHQGSVLRAGSEALIQFSLGGFRGDDVLAAGSPTSARVDCDRPGTPTTGRLARSRDGLQYDAATGRYTFAWQTDRSWAWSCRAFILTLRNGSVERLVVSFRPWSRHHRTYWHREH